MSDIIISMKNAFLDYFSFGGISHVIMLLFAMFVIILFVKDIKVKRISVYIPLIVVFLIILNPIVYKIIAATYEYSYYRTYWLILFPVIIGTAICIVMEKAEEQKRFITLVIAVVTILVTGMVHGVRIPIFPVQNVYRLDNQVMKVADIIEADECNKKNAIVPEDMAWQIRQYKDIKILYDKDGWILYIKDANRAAYNMINGKGEFLPKVMAETATDTGFPFVVIKSGIADREIMWENGFKNIGQTEDYEIYRQTTY